MQEGLGFPVDDRVVEWPDVLRECCSGSGARLRNGDAHERSPQPGAPGCGVLRSFRSGPPSTPSNTVWSSSGTDPTSNKRPTGEIVARAWNRLKTYDDVEPELSEFVATYRNRGPEKVNCDLT